MNCTDLDTAFDQGISAINTDVGFWAAVGTLAVASFTVLCFGQRVTRPLAGVLAFVGATLGLFWLMDSVACEVRIVVSLVAGTMAATLALCLLKGGMFILGGAAFGTVVHFTYEAIDFPHKPPFEIMGRSGVYYLTVGGAAIIGAVTSVCFKKHFMRITTSLIGGGGVALVLYLCSNRNKWDLASVVYLSVLLGSALMGIFIQRWLSSRRRTETRRSDSRDDGRNAV